MASSVCRSLQCLISALTQGDSGGLLFRFICSVVLWGGRNPANKYTCCVWRVLAVSWPHWVCTTHGLCFPSLHCSGFRLLCREWALGCVYFPGLSCSGLGSWVLRKGTDSVGPAFCPFPSLSSSGNQELDERTLPGAARLLPSPSPPQFPGATVRCALCLFWGADLWL